MPPLDILFVLFFAIHLDQSFIGLFLVTKVKWSTLTLKHTWRLHTTRIEERRQDGHCCGLISLPSLNINSCADLATEMHTGTGYQKCLKCLHMPYPWTHGFLSRVWIFGANLCIYRLLCLKHCFHSLFVSFQWQCTAHITVSSHNKMH